MDTHKQAHKHMAQMLYIDHFHATTITTLFFVFTDIVSSQCIHFKRNHITKKRPSPHDTKEEQSDGCCVEVAYWPHHISIFLSILSSAFMIFRFFSFLGICNFLCSFKCFQSNWQSGIKSKESPSNLQNHQPPVHTNIMRSFT